MTQYASRKAIERSTYKVRVYFTDADMDPETPNVGSWTLTDSSNTVINSRRKVNLGSFSTDDAGNIYVDIILHGNDLQILSGEEAPFYRWLLVECLYTSQYVVNAPLKDQLRFEIDDLLRISGTSSTTTTTTSTSTTTTTVAP